MPYIDYKTKKEINKIQFNTSPIGSCGELNYAIHKLLENYLDNNGLSYQSINDIEGALSCVKQEFYRRIAKPYEKKKLKENGDIIFYEKYER